MKGLGFALLAYIGPETIIPATSILAAVCGLLLAWGKWLTGPVVAAFACVFKKSKDSHTGDRQGGDNN